MKKDDGTYDDDKTINITVLDYFTKHRKIEITYSAYIPCIDVGKPKKPNYLPLEVESLSFYFFYYYIFHVFLMLLPFCHCPQLCSLVSLQRYTKALSTLQRASLVEKSRQKPPEKMRVIIDVKLYFTLTPF